MIVIVIVEYSQECVMCDRPKIYFNDIQCVWNYLISKECGNLQGVMLNNSISNISHNYHKKACASNDYKIYGTPKQTLFVDNYVFILIIFPFPAHSSPYLWVCFLNSDFFWHAPISYSFHLSPSFSLFHSHRLHLLRSLTLSL